MKILKKLKINNTITASDLNTLSARFCPRKKEETERQRQYKKAEKLVLRLIRNAVENGFYAITINPWENICIFAREEVLKDFEKRGLKITNIGNSKGLSWGFPSL